MRKKIPCKVIRSVSLSGDSPSVQSAETNLSNVLNIETFHSIPGIFTYNSQLKKSFISNGVSTCSGILDCYV